MKKHVNNPETTGLIIHDLLEYIRMQYMTEKVVIPILLSRDEKKVQNLKILDGLYGSVLTSLQFGQYRRAVWYLQAFAKFAAQYLDPQEQETILQSLNKNFFS